MEMKNECEAGYIWSILGSGVSMQSGARGKI